MRTVQMTVNGKAVTEQIEARMLLVDFLRDRLRLTGTHIGCDTSQCGACVVHIDGVSVKSCSMLAVQANGCRVVTIEGVADGTTLHPLQRAFQEQHALQCGFCTPGMVMSVLDLLNRKENPTDGSIRLWLEGNLCRCTGYDGIVRAVRAVAQTRTTVAIEG